MELTCTRVLLPIKIKQELTLMRPYLGSKKSGLAKSTFKGRRRLPEPNGTVLLLCLPPTMRYNRGVVERAPVGFAPPGLLFGDSLVWTQTLNHAP